MHTVNHSPNHHLNGGQNNMNLEQKFQLLTEGFDEEIKPTDLKKLKALQITFRQLKNLVSPLFQENQQLKDRIINLNHYIQENTNQLTKLVRDYSIKGESRILIKNIGKLEEIIDLIAEDMSYGQREIANFLDQQKKNIQYQNHLTEDHQNQIKELLLEKQREQELLLQKISKVQENSSLKDFLLNRQEMIVEDLLEQLNRKQIHIKTQNSINERTKWDLMEIIKKKDQTTEFEKDQIRNVYLIQISGLESQIQDLKHKLVSSNQEVDNLVELKIKELSQEYDVKLNLKDVEIRGLQILNENQEDQIQDFIKFKKQVDDGDFLNEQCLNYKAEIQNLSDQLSITQNELSQLTLKFTQVKDEQQNIIQQLKQKKNDLNLNQRDMNKKLKTLQNELESKKQEIANLTQHIKIYQQTSQQQQAEQSSHHKISQKVEVQNLINQQITPQQTNHKQIINDQETPQLEQTDTPYIISFNVSQNQFNLKENQLDLAQNQISENQNDTSNYSESSKLFQTSRWLVPSRQQSITQSEDLNEYSQKLTHNKSVECDLLKDYIEEQLRISENKLNAELEIRLNTSFQLSQLQYEQKISEVENEKLKLQQQLDGYLKKTRMVSQETYDQAQVREQKLKDLQIQLESKANEISRQQELIQTLLIQKEQNKNASPIKENKIITQRVNAETNSSIQQFIDENSQNDNEREFTQFYKYNEKEQFKKNILNNDKQNKIFKNKFWEQDYYKKSEEYLKLLNQNTSLKEEQAILYSQIDTLKKNVKNQQKEELLIGDFRKNAFIPVEQHSKNSPNSRVNFKEYQKWLISQSQNITILEKNPYVNNFQFQKHRMKAGKTSAFQFSSISHNSNIKPLFQNYSFSKVKTSMSQHVDKVYLGDKESKESASLPKLKQSKYQFINQNNLNQFYTEQDEDVHNVLYQRNQSSGQVRALSNSDYVVQNSNDKSFNLIISNDILKNQSPQQKQAFLIAQIRKKQNTKLQTKK